MDLKNMDERKKHPVCEMKGCDLLQAAQVEIDGVTNPYTGEKVSGPTKVMVCIKHARMITGHQDISMSAKSE